MTSPARHTLPAARRRGAAWAPMQSPPLPARDDLEFNTCVHAYPAEECQATNGTHEPDSSREDTP